MLGRYKGKREAPRGENVPGERELDPFTPGTGEKGDPFDQNVTREPAAGVGDPFAEGPASTESAAPEGEDLWEELRRLPEKDRTVLHLYYYEDMTTEEIAKLLDRNPATVRSQLLRARAKLKKLLVEEG